MLEWVARFLSCLLKCNLSENRGRDVRWLGVTFSLVAAVAVSYFAYRRWIDISVIVPDESCAQRKVPEHIEKAIASLDGNIDLGIKLSTAIVGAGGALLLGIESGMALPRWTKIILISAMLPFVQTAFYGVWWRLQVGFIWIQQCPEILQHKRVQAIYEAAFAAFAEGAAATVFLLVIVSMLGANRSPSRSAKENDV